MLSSTTFNRPGLTESRRMNDHTSKNFDLELESLRTRVLEREITMPAGRA